MRKNVWTRSGAYLRRSSFEDWVPYRSSYGSRVTVDETGIGAKRTCARLVFIHAGPAGRRIILVPGPVICERRTCVYLRSPAPKGSHEPRKRDTGAAIPSGKPTLVESGARHSWNSRQVKAREKEREREREREEDGTLDSWGLMNDGRLATTTLKLSA